jgi:hypothetical protein
MRPPGLAWLDSFCKSTELAMSQAIVAEVKGTVNPLTYIVKLRWHEPIAPETSNIVWNIFQKWAATNESIPSGRVEHDVAINPFSKEPLHLGMQMMVSLKERLGHPKDKNPLA